jgi:hypothetical protein
VLEIGLEDIASGLATAGIGMLVQSVTHSACAHWSLSARKCMRSVNYMLISRESTCTDCVSCCTCDVCAAITTYMIEMESVTALSALASEIKNEQVLADTLEH